MSNTTDIASNKYVSLTTFTKAGEPKPLPVWIVELADGRVGFTTSPDSWKVKRIENDPNVTLRPCDKRGVVEEGAPTVEGVAEVSNGEEFAEVKRLVSTKYGVWVTVVEVMNTVRGLFTKGTAQSRTAVLIRLDEAVS